MGNILGINIDSTLVIDDIKAQERVVQKMAYGFLFFFYVSFRNLKFQRKISVGCNFFTKVLESLT